MMIKFHDSCKNPDIVQGPPGLLFTPQPLSLQIDINLRIRNQRDMTGTLELTQDILIFRIEQEQISPLFHSSSHATPETIQTNPEYETHRHYK